jgi:hypothetical protein
MSCANQVHNISFCDTNDEMVPALIETESGSGTSIDTPVAGSSFF